jgi:hypothetical protein
LPSSTFLIDSPNSLYKRWASSLASLSFVLKSSLIDVSTLSTCSDKVVMFPSVVSILLLISLILLLMASWLSAIVWLIVLTLSVIVLLMSVVLSLIVLLIASTSSSILE